MDMLYRLVFFTLCITQGATLLANKGGCLSITLMTEDGRAVAGAVVQVADTSVVTDAQGKAVVCVPDAAPGSGPGRIKIEKQGYMAMDTLANGQDLTFVMAKGDEIPAVTITAFDRTGQLGDDIGLKRIDKAQIQSAAAQNLTDIASLSSGLMAMPACAVCATTEIRMNGLPGAYTLIAVDGVPMMGALGSVYGLSGIPAGIVESIDIMRGPASVYYGSDALAGVINIRTRSPYAAPKVFADVRGSTHQEWNADFAASYGKGRWQHLTSATAFMFQNRMDRNGDGFTDVPLQNRLSLFQKSGYRNRHSFANFLAGRVYVEDRMGGQMDWQPMHRGGDSVYGESIHTYRAEVFGMHYFASNENGQLWAQYGLNAHHQNSAYGDQLLNATEANLFSQLLYRRNIAGKTKLTLGLPLRLLGYEDDSPALFDGESSARQEIRTGTFANADVQLSKNQLLQAGYRLEWSSYHNLIHNPRMAYNLQVDRNTQLRALAGTGFRVVNLFTEEHAALSGSRRVVVEERLSPEKSYNLTVSGERYVGLKNGYMNLALAGFYTLFTNRILPDYGQDDAIVYRNLRGHGVSRGFWVEGSYTGCHLQGDLGITVSDNYVMEEAQPAQVPLSPQVMGAGNVRWTLPNCPLTLAANSQLYGPMHLVTVENDYRPPMSPWYALVGLQATWTPRHQWELYAGVRNMLDFVPTDPILRPHDPFDQRVDENNPLGYTFDATYGYAPLQGRRFYVGLRWHLDK